MAGTFTVQMFEDWIDQIDKRKGDEAAEAAASYRRLNEAIERVREIHQPLDAVMFTPDRGQYLRKVCTGCGTDNGNWQVWPCPTVRAVDGVKG